MIDIKIKRGVEVDEKGNLWAYKTEEFKNGDDQPTERIVRNKIREKDIKGMDNDLIEQREKYHKSKSHMENFETTIESKEFKDFKKSVREGQLKNLFDCYVQERFLEEKISKDKKIKNIKEYLKKEMVQIDRALDELKDFENQIKQAKEHFKK